MSALSKSGAKVLTFDYQIQKHGASPSQTKLFVKYSTFGPL
jgi:hypothetical protein